MSQSKADLTITVNLDDTINIVNFALDNDGAQDQPDKAVTEFIQNAANVGLIIEPPTCPIGTYRRLCG